MGYSEITCSICGVSFNIGRIRTPQEPRNAAWAAWGLPTRSPDSYVDGGERSCGRSAGCMFTIRKVKDLKREYEVDAKGRRRLGEKIEEDLNADLDGYVDHDDRSWKSSEGSDDEPLEFVSDDEALGGNKSEEGVDDVVMTDTDDIEDISKQESLRRFWSGALQEYDEKEDQKYIENSVHCPAWFRGPPPHTSTLANLPVEDEMFPLYYPGRDDASENGSDASFECTDYPEGSAEWLNAKFKHRIYGKLGYQQYGNYAGGLEVEHIAGPGCKNHHGYSGHEISVEEMRGCQTAQCLVWKHRNSSFDPLPDDEDFEKDGNFFLSGLTDHMPSRDENVPTVTPPRHNCERPHAENFMLDMESIDDVYGYAMPFHPGCLEVFKRVTQLAYGHVDVNALTNWWSLESTYYVATKFPRDSNVFVCSNQWYEHKPGTAYLVANPLFIPRLNSILEAAIERSPNFSPKQRAFRALGPGTGARDPFQQLPVELQFHILDYLPPKDIATLRFCSRVFSELSVSWFQKLILREMPWLWEAWPPVGKHASPTPYSPWATMTAHEVKLKLQREGQELAKLNDYVDIVKQEMPELAQQLDTDFARCYQDLMEAREKDAELQKQERTPFFLPPEQTNYFTLYTLITRHWSELRGLQNRARIWEDCEEIRRRVEKYKEEGLIDEKGRIGDLHAAVKIVMARADEEKRRRREETMVMATSLLFGYELIEESGF